LEAVRPPIPDADTEPQEPVPPRSPEPKTISDHDLAAPALPAMSFFDKTSKDPEQAIPTGAPRVALPPMMVPASISATWEESQSLLVAPSVVVEKPPAERRLRFVTLALVASIAAQLGTFAAEHLVPRAAARIYAAEVTYDRVMKSGRSIRTAQALGLEIPSEVSRLQRDAETAAFSGDADTARRRIEEIHWVWRPE
jgi:hypothetical protein